VILPQQPMFDVNEYKKKFNAKEVPLQFCYNSGDNDQWETVEGLRELIKQYVDPNFEPK
jgi:hypothetical protein